MEPVRNTLDLQIPMLIPTVNLPYVNLTGTSTPLEGNPNSPLKEPVTTALNPHQTNPKPTLLYHPKHSLIQRLFKGARYKHPGPPFSQAGPGSLAATACSSVVQAAGGGSQRLLSQAQSPVLEGAGYLQLSPAPLKGS